MVAGAEAGFTQEAKAANDTDSEDFTSSDEETDDEFYEEPELTGWPAVKHAINQFVDSRSCTTVMAIVTFYALFGDDFRLGFCPKSADEAFMVLSSVSFFLFLVELVLNSLGKTECGPRDKSGHWRARLCGLRGYLGSFFFTLDFVATLSLLPEITWMWGPIIGDTDTGSTNLEAARAGRVSRAGSKAGRIIRMVRLVRLVKLYMLTRKKKGENEGVKQSKVGAKLSDLTTRRVIVVVLLMLIVVPIFSYTEEDFSEEFATAQLHAFNLQRPDNWESSAEQLKLSFQWWDEDQEDHRLVKLLLEPATVNTTALALDMPDVYDDLRTGLSGNELKKVVYEEDVGGVTYKTEAWFDQKLVSQETAYLGIGLTIFVTILLAAGALQFTSDAQRLVLHPIESMATLVKEMGSNPLKETSSRDNSGQFETNLLENTVKKIGGLLRVGFGQAGAPIIATNLQSSEGAFNPMVEGQRIHAIFGFIYILKFSMITEVLEEDVLTFVNKISKVVHDVAMSWGGHPNKNLGDAYLLSWRLKEPEAPPRDEGVSPTKKARRASTAAGLDFYRTPTASGLRRRRSSMASRSSVGSRVAEDVDLSTLPESSETAGKALMAFLKIIAEVSRSRDLLDSPENARLQAKMPGYYVRLQYGLHAGWGIEGAIGSIHKVDASYLSPHVNIASRMCAAAKQYGKSILMSSVFYDLLGETAARYCRLVDVIQVKGSKVALPVYTYDVWEWRTKVRWLLSFASSLHCSPCLVVLCAATFFLDEL